MNRIVPGLALTFLLSNCSEVIVSPTNNDTVKYEQFETIWHVVDQEYPFLDFKAIDWNAMYDTYKSRIADSEGDQYLVVLTELLAELKDGHVGLELKSGLVRPYKTPREKKDFLSYSPELVRSYFDAELELLGEGQMSFGIIDGTIGYIRIATWDEGNGYWIRDLDVALGRLRETKGLIIDVRHNGGGCDCIRDPATRRFLTDTLQAPGSYRNGEFIEGVSLIPINNVPYENDIVVLINGVSFSATEIFARDMKTIDRVTVVGDTTGGGGASVQYYDLPHEAKLKLTFRNYLRYDLEPIEWNGIEPDILIPQTAADVQNGTDKQLEFSIDLLKQE